MASETTGVCAAAGCGDEKEGTKTGALTLGTKEAALTFRVDILAERLLFEPPPVGDESSMSQLSATPSPDIQTTT